MSSKGAMQESILPVCDKPLYKIKENIPHWEKLKNLLNSAYAYQFIRDVFVVDVFVLVQPNLHEPDSVAAEDLADVAAPAVGAGRPEDMAHLAARVDLQSAPTHPHLGTARQVKCL